MFDEGQKLPTPYHQTKFESEKLVRDGVQGNWRVYRPAIVVGDSRTGEMDKIDGPYYFFKVLQKVRHSLPEWFPLVGARGRLDEHRPGRLGRRRDGPHRAPRRPRQPGLPPRQPAPAARRRRAQHVRPRRPRAADGHAPRQAHDRHAPEGRPVLRDEAAGAQGHPPRAARRPRDPGLRARATWRSCRASTRATRSARCATPASRCRRSTPTPRSCGTTGSATSTRTSSRTAPSRAPSTARRS